MSVGVLWLFGFFSILRRWLSTFLPSLLASGVVSVEVRPSKTKRLRTTDAKSPLLALDGVPAKSKKVGMTHREIMQILISIVILAVGMYVLFVQDKSNNRELASGFVGSVISFWLKQK